MVPYHNMYEGHPSPTTSKMGVLLLEKTLACVKLFTDYQAYVKGQLTVLTVFRAGGKGNV